MQINIKKLLLLPVYTEGGTRLGKVGDVVLDIDNHSVWHYVVYSGGLMSKDTYLIRPVQVKSITADKMIVEENVTKEPTKEKVIPTTNPAKSLGNIMSREDS
ncbi:MAG TPA: PRC-barrel domain-containing protein [Patescibacteria group bacterium]|nr:PRC-barrel domain-containing protein [Patescibacteria group bacterium]